MRLRSASLIFFAAWAALTGWNSTTFNKRAALLRRWGPDVVALPRPEAIKFFSLGFKSVLADYYWVGAVQYLGAVKNQKVFYGELKNYIDLVIALAPDFHPAYSFGGTGIPWNDGTRWVHVDEAIDILKQGVERFPNDWFLRLLLAYDYANYMGRYKDAGDQLTRAAVVRGAPSWIGPLATRMYATPGDLDTALSMAEAIYSQSQDSSVRHAMNIRIHEIEIQRDLKMMSRAIQNFKKDRGAYPPTLQALVDAGYLPVVPEEELGGSYNYSSELGVVTPSHPVPSITIYQKTALAK